MQLIFSKDETLNQSQELFDQVLERLAICMPNLTHSKVELWLTGNENIQKLNKDFRSKDKPTDVLSFSLNDQENLGQIVISVERAESQAKEIGQSLEEELRFLFAHGLLHLLGYDHETPEEEKQMLKKAYEILEREAPKN